MRFIAVSCICLQAFLGGIALAGEENTEQRLVVAAAQVALDRAGFSPGAIDGEIDQQTVRALRAFQATAHLLPTGELDADTVEGLGEIFNHPFIEYTIEAAAAHHAIESIADRFHTTPAFIRELNGDRTFAAGEQIRVPNAVPAERPMKNWWRTERAGGSPHVTVAISRAEQAVRVNVGGWTHFYAPFAVAAGHQQHNWSDHDQATHRCLEIMRWDAERVAVLAGREATWAVVDSR